MRLSKEYIAGFFDGEGCVQINTTQGAGRGHHLTISIAQKDPTILLLIFKQYPEFSLESGSPKSGVNYLRLHGRNSFNFLTDIKEFSILKKTQIELALEFILLLKSNSKKINNNELELRNSIVEKIKSEKQNPTIVI